ncbi:Lrp/AsnC family transcriptional regulator [Rhodococcus sp. IC4_135]|nr:Lrp/AsnC family transcriptional regulator [Rhodococcus sp. IC4_135]UJC81229.1 Lrp/AsnC family transcriptional regulator [Rhodococcus erythropolis]
MIENSQEFRMSDESMKEFDMLDAADQAMVHALQINPRASWSQIGKALDLDPVTLSRRWIRLVDRGAAWIGCNPGPILAASGLGNLAFVEIDCVNGSVQAVAHALSEQRMVTGIEHVTGARDLLVTVMVTDLSVLSQWATEELGAIAGVVSSRIQLAGTIYTGGSRWRLRALSSSQADALAATRITVDHHGAFRPTDMDRRIMVALSVDGRASYTELAEECGASVDTIRRRARRLFAAGMARPRCEVARPLSGSQVTVILWAQVSPSQIGHAALTISAMPEVRRCTGVTGRDNLLIVAWARSVDDAQRLEGRLCEALPGLSIADRVISLWTMKLNGHLLDERGYRVGAVPISPGEPARRSVEPSA